MKEKTKQQTYERLPLTWDFAFKNVFGTYGREDILKRFLSAILNKNITKVAIQNGELPKDTKDQKLGILDIRAEIDGIELVDIEIQVKDEDNITERTMHYLSKLYSGQIKVAENYKTMKKSIVIAILGFTYYNRAEYHSIVHMKFDKNNNLDERLEQYEGKEEQELLTDKLELHIIDLKKFKQKKNAKGELCDWLNLILGEEEKIKMVEKNNREIEKANKIVEEMGQDPETRELYRLIEKGRIEENTRISNALEKDRREIAKKLLKLGLPIEQIVEVSKLPREEIEVLEPSTEEEIAKQKLQNPKNLRNNKK